MFCPYLDSNVKNEDSNYDEAFWVNVSTDSKENYGSVVARTKDNPFNTEVFTIASVMNIKSNKDAKKNTYSNKEYYSDNTLVFDIKESETISIEKYVAITTTRDYKENELVEKAECILSKEANKGYEIVLQEQSKAWNKR